jgi:anti-anti-sigma factor
MRRGAGELDAALAVDGERVDDGFRVDVRPDRRRVLVCPIGEIDLATAGDVEQHVAELLDEGFGHVVVDLRGVSFLDSSGVRLMVVAHERARRAGARLSLILGSPRSARALELSGVLDVLEIIDR